MITCPICQRPPTKRDGRDHRGRQRYACRPCHRDFTAGSSSIFAGYRWPAEVILAAVRWYLLPALGPAGDRAPGRARHQRLSPHGADLGPELRPAARPRGPPLSAPDGPAVVRRRGLHVPRSRETLPLPRRRSTRAGDRRAAVRASRPGRGGGVLPPRAGDLSAGSDYDRQRSPSGLREGRQALRTAGPTHPNRPAPPAGRDHQDHRAQPRVPPPARFAAPACGSPASPPRAAAPRSADTRTGAAHAPVSACAGGAATPVPGPAAVAGIGSSGADPAPDTPCVPRPRAARAGGERCPGGGPGS